MADGTIVVPWWINALEKSGIYKTIYMPDMQNLLLSTYTITIKRFHPH